MIRAYNVTEAKRSALYRAAYDYTGNQVTRSQFGQGRGKDQSTFSGRIQVLARDWNSRWSDG